MEGGLLRLFLMERCLEEDLVDFEGHALIDLEVVVEVEPRPVERPLGASDGAVLKHPGLPRRVEVYVRLQLREHSVLNHDIALVRPPYLHDRFARVLIRQEVEDLPR